MLASTAVVEGQNSSGCSRVESEHSLDVCPFLDETVLFNCRYASSVPADLQALAGDLILFDNMNSILDTQTLVFSSINQNGQYSCRTTKPVCSNAVASQNFNIAVLGKGNTCSLLNLINEISKALSG